MNQTELSETDEFVMPCAEAILAGTLALMTGHAQSSCVKQRALMGRKVLSNLFSLGKHPRLSPNFRTVVQRMHQHWESLLEAYDKVETSTLLNADDLLPERRLWHPTAPNVQ